MISLVLIIFGLVSILLSVAFLTLLERKFLSLVGIRLGPYKVSFLGVLQPIGDALKLMNKQSNSLTSFSIYFYYVSCAFLFMFSLLVWGCFWLNPYFTMLNMSLIFFMMFLSFCSLFVIFSGWSSFGKYTLLGSLRSVVQLVSYESSLYFCLFVFFFLLGSLKFSDYFYLNLKYSLVFIFPCFLVWLISILCELNRSPFDFSEGESELVSGFNTDLGSSSFTLLFLAEYSNIMFFCFCSSILFFYNNFFLFCVLMMVFVIWIRSVVPRFRFDKMMSLAWKLMIPFITFYFMCFVLI